eukprot:CAMPEP_0197890250 /NCGR_PEP_ID=MMETSP1439-20131203/25988_1 /TAXON_ID=66791 /ORGANISM="Gonyaulax spinifera, Strain CCMP409" /LENGTH=114 /DNA_ID=CAMNT_0043510269 /DNA_START=54 /DNA_END=396 /DNA_ORIENTATION=+
MAASAQLLRRAMARGVAQAARAPKQPLPGCARGCVTKSASPETPLMHYTATQQATSSINHRLFYVNVAFLVLVVDAGSAVLDVEPAWRAGASGATRAPSMDGCCPRAGFVLASP